MIATIDRTGGEKLVFYFETYWKRELTGICFIKNMVHVYVDINHNLTLERGKRMKILLQGQGTVVRNWDTHLIFARGTQNDHCSVLGLTGQVARKSSRPKSCRLKPQSCRPKFIVMSPEILSHVARNPKSYRPKFYRVFNLEEKEQSQGINS